MKSLRIKLVQNQANFRKEETNTNKMTYPLPPFSTVIGALHNACNFKQYHPMDVSIQGNFGAMQIEPYTHHMFLNNFQNDRGIMVKLKKSNAHSTAFDKVAEAIKPQGNDFFKEITIRVLNREIFDEWKSLKILKNGLEDRKKSDENLKILDKEIKDFKAEQKPLDKKSERFLELKEIINTKDKQKKQIEQDYKEKIAQIDEELAKFATLITSVKYYEVLYEVFLMIHIKADEKTLENIMENIHNLQSIGRNEDFVDVLECKMVEISDKANDEIISKYSGYIKSENIYNDNIFSKSATKGTKYFLNKDYVIEENKRIFNKFSVVYAENFAIDDEESELGEETGIFIDEDGNIINFV